MPISYSLSAYHPSLLAIGDLVIKGRRGGFCHRENGSYTPEGRFLFICTGLEPHVWGLHLGATALFFRRSLAFSGD